MVILTDWDLLMMKKIGLALLCNLLMLSQVYAKSWTLIDKSSGNEFRLYFDETSIHTVNVLGEKNYQQAWFKNEIINDLNTEDGLAVGDYMLNLWRFDCQAYRLAGVKSIRYNKKGEYIEQINNPVRTMRDVIPSTAGQLMWSRVCAKKNK